MFVNDALKAFEASLTNIFVLFWKLYLRPLICHTYEAKKTECLPLLLKNALDIHLKYLK